MKKIITLLLLFVTLIATAQNPLIVKSVGTTALQPILSGQSEFWKYNEWNGMRFYQGTGTSAKLCVTDGTTSGTKLVADLNTTSSPIASSIGITIPAQDFMYLIVANTINITPGAIEYQLWRSDGTTVGTSLIYTFEQCTAYTAPLFGSTANYFRNYSVSGNTFYFTAYTAAYGRELWKSDGTAAGTFMVKDIRVGTASGNAAGFCKLGTDIYFFATETYPNSKLWKTDGTAAGTVQVPVTEPFFTGYSYVALINNKMIFYASDNISVLNYEPYVSDGTAAGTFKLAEINPLGSSHPWFGPEVQLKQNNKHAYFIADNGTPNFALWRTDGTVTGTIQLSANGENVSTSSGSYSDIDENGLWLLKYNSGGSAMYKSNGTASGTYKIIDGLSAPTNLKIFNNALWFTCRRTGGYDDVEAWRSDGTAANTNKALDIAPGNAAPTYAFSSDPFGYFTKNNKLYFFATNTNYITGGTPMALYQYTGDFTFNGSQAGGRWRDSTNWNSMMPPGITDTVNINTGTANALNITGQRAYAGLLNVGNNATINLTAITDSLQINNSIVTNATNNFTGNGVLVLRNNSNDTVQLNNSFAANNIAIQSSASLLSGNVTVNNILNCTNNGKLILNNNGVTLQGNTSTATGNATSYIVTNGTGKMTIQNVGTGARTTAVNFPIGTATNYNPMQFTNAGTADNFSARVQPTIGTNYTGEIPSAGTYSTNAVNATWFITEAIDGGSNATINLQWNAGQELVGFNRSISQFGHYNIGAWQLQSQNAATGTNPYNLIGTGITSFSPFGIFNTGAVLPISNIQLSGTKGLYNTNVLSWNITVSNGYRIELQKSTDAINFDVIKYADYQAFGSFVDALSTQPKLYYRIKLIDAEGKIKYSNMVIMLSDKNDSIQVYPTLTNTSITIQNNEAPNLQLQILSADGKIILNKNLIKGTNIISIEQAAAGAYFYQIQNKEIVVKKGKMVKY